MQKIYKFAPPAVGAVFAYSGVYKLLEPAQSMAALVALDVPLRFAIVTILVVTVLELYCATLLLTRWDLKVGMQLGTGLLLVFAVFLFHLSIMADPPKCGCMGITEIFKSNRQNAVFGLFRNCVLLWLLSGTYRLTIPSEPAPSEPSPRICKT